MTTRTKGRGCAGKKPLTEKAARAQGRRFIALGGAPNRLSVYRCLHAKDGHWHVGHTSRRKR